MPTPNPFAIWIEDGNFYFERYFWTGNIGNRLARVVSIRRRMNCGTWRCRWCRVELDMHKRSDARYCCEGCRKRAARARRQLRAKGLYLGQAVVNYGPLTGKSGGS